MNTTYILLIAIHSLSGYAAAYLCTLIIMKLWGKKIKFTDKTKIAYLFLVSLTILFGTLFFQFDLFSITAIINGWV